MGWIVLAGLLGVGVQYVGSLAHELSRPPARLLPVYGELGEFTLTNQFGQTVNLASLRGQACVADFIFTRCAGPCPKMSQAMRRLQSALHSHERVRLLSVTADPEHDTPAVLQHYGERYQARPDRWWLLTGETAQIHRLALGLKVVAQEADAAARAAGEDLFIHSTKFVLIDARGRIRGYYDGADPDAEPRLLHDLASVAPVGASD